MTLFGPNSRESVLIDNSIRIFNKHLIYKSRDIIPRIISEYDQEIPQSQTADDPMTPRGRAAQPSRDTRKTN